jgi:spore coat protein U-like protein
LVQRVFMFIVCAIALLIFMPGVASSASDETTMQISTNVVNTTTCAIESVPPLDFGVYYISGNAVSQLQYVQIFCDHPANYSIDAGSGNNSQGGTRRMTDGAGHYLDYQLYIDQESTAIWGAGFSGGQAIYGSGNNLNWLAYFGEIPGGQNPATGGYSDTVVVSLNW